MDKQELIHTHTLLAELRKYVNRTEDVPTPEYDDMDVSPIALTATANDHEEAVFTLADELSSNLPTGEATTPETTPGITAD